MTPNTWFFWIKPLSNKMSYFLMNTCFRCSKVKGYTRKLGNRLRNTKTIKISKKIKCHTLYGISIEGTVLSRILRHNSTWICLSGESSNLSKRAMIGSDPPSVGFEFAPYLLIEWKNDDNSGELLITFHFCVSKEIIKNNSRSFLSCWDVYDDSKSYCYGLGNIILKIGYEMTMHYDNYSLTLSYNIRFFPQICYSIVKIIWMDQITWLLAK